MRQMYESLVLLSGGEDNEDSDIDLLGRFLPGASLLDQVGLSDELGQLFNRHVDVVSDKAINKYFKEKVMNEAQDL